MKKIILILLLICSLPYSYAGYFNSPVTLQLNSNESAFFDNATISEIMKDSRGFMWFATDRGIHCYGGVTSREFRYTSGRHRITSMSETFEQLFFLLDDNGRIGCFDRDNEKFIDIRYDNKLLDGMTNNYHYSKKTGLYASNQNGLFVIDYRVENRGANGRLLLIPRQIPQIKESLHLVASDTSGNIYAVVRESLDVIRYNPSNGTVKKIDLNIPSTGTIRKAYKFFVIDDLFWLTYSWNELICYDLKEERQLNFNPTDKINKLNVDFSEIKKIIKLDQYSYCVATSNGVVSFSFQGKPSTKTFSVEFSPFTVDLNGKYIEPRTTSIYADTTKRILWTGTFGGGIVKYGDALDTFINIPNTQIYNVTEDKRGYIWLTSAREGVMRSTKPSLDPATTFEQHLISSVNRQRYEMYNDGERYIWFGDNGGKLIRVDQYTEEISSFQVTLDGKTPTPTKINAMLVDSKGYLWLASDNRLLRWDQRSDRFEVVTISDLPSSQIVKVIEDRQGTIWIGTLQGLYMIEQDPDHNYVAYGGYEEMVNDQPSEVYALEMNGKGDVIATYSDKLIRIGVQNKRAIELHLCVDKGTLPSGHVLKIMDDKYGSTWFGTSTRIMTIKSGGSNVFTYSMSANNRDACRLRDGRLVWTASGGLIYYSPEQAQRKSMAEQFVLSRVKIHDKDVFSSDKVDGVTTFTGSVNDVQSLLFTEDQTDFQIFVSDLSFTSFQKQLLYKLEPTMTEWRVHSAENGLMFPSIQPGEYQLHIRPLFLDESQGDQKTFEITIKPKWNNSTLAKVVFLLIFAIGVWVIFIFTKKRWQELTRRQVHRVFEAINSNTDQNVADSAKNGQEEENPKMLIIGNDREKISSLTEIFAEDFDVCHSTNSADAIIDALFHLPKVIICLYSTANALECCSKMKNNDRTCPIPFIFIDNVDNASNRVSAVEARADDYIPYDSQELGMIRQVVENRVAGRDAIHQIYSKILIDRNQTLPESSEVSVNIEDHFTRSVNEMIETNLKDADFSVKRLSELMGMSQSTLYRKLMAASGRTIIEAIRDARLRRAAELLKDGRLTIAAIAEEVGYLDVATFRKHFFDLYGVNPSRFIKQQ